MKYCGNTTNLLFHLRTKHPTEFNEVSNPDNSPKEGRLLSVNSKAASSSADNRQLTLPATIQATLPLPKSSTRYKKVTDAICYFLTRDMQPYDTVNDEGFHHMLKVIEPRYSPPDRKTIANTFFFQSCMKQKERKSKQIFRMLDPFLLPQIYRLHEPSIHTLP